MIVASIQHYQAWELFTNRWFWSGMGAWFVASLIKMAINLARTHKIDFTYLVSTGGMPSSHSASVCGLASGLGFSFGFGSPIAVFAWAFAAITMFDASTVRYAAGEHAKVLNAILDDLKELKFRPTQRFKELLGHTRTEVFWGMVTGILWATALNTIL